MSNPSGPDGGDRPAAVDPGGRPRPAPVPGAPETVGRIDGLALGAIAVGRGLIVGPGGSSAGLVRVAAVLHLRDPRPGPAGGRRGHRRIAALLTDAARPTPLGDAVAAASARPILLIAAGTEPDEITAAEFLRLRSPGTVSVWTVPGAGHIGALATDPGGWERRVTGFLSAAMGGGRQSPAAPDPEGPGRARDQGP